MLRHPGILGGPQRQARGAKSEVVASPRPSWGPKRGRKCYATPAFSGVPNAKRGEQNHRCLPQPCLLGGPKQGANAMLPLHSRGSPTPSTGSKIRTWFPHPCLLGGPKDGGIAKSPRQIPGSPTPSVEGKIRSGYLAPAFYGTQKRVEMLRHPCILGSPQRQARGAKSEVAASPLPSWGPKRGRKCYVTPAFSGVPNAKRGEQNHRWLPHSGLLGGPKEGGNATLPLHSRGCPMPSVGSKIIGGCLTPAFLGAQKRVEMLRHPGILGGPQRQARGAKSEVVASPRPSWGPKRGRKCYATPAFSGVPNAKRGEQNHRCLPQPCLLGGPKQGANATLPLHSRGSPTPSTGSKIRTWFPHPCLLGGPKDGGIAKSPRQIPGSPTPSVEGKIRSGYLAPAFYGTQKRVEMLRHPCILGSPQRQARGAKSEVAASPLPSWGPKRGRKCYVTPAFSGVPNAKRGEQNHR